MRELAGQFGIHRQTVSDILKREGVLRAPGIQPDDLPDLVRLYEEGWSMRRLGARFGVAAGTVGNALRKAGVVIRPPGPGPACP